MPAPRDLNNDQAGDLRYHARIAYSPIDHYAGWVDPDEFYYLPRAALAHLVYPSELDTLDLLCSQLSLSEAAGAARHGARPPTRFEDPFWAAGTVEFLLQPEAAWLEADVQKLLPALLSGPRYRAAKRALRARGVLHDFDPAARLRPRPPAAAPAGPDGDAAQAELRRLRRGLASIRYELPHARQAGRDQILFRPRAYLAQRWPVWFTDRNWGEWAVCLALMDWWGDECRARAPRAHGPRAPEMVVSATRDQIVARSLALLPAACGQPGEHDRLTAGKVDDALDTLFGLGLLDLDRTAGAPRYRLDLRAFHQAPCPDLARLATHCGLHAIDDAARLRLLQTLVRHSFVPAGELRAVAAAIDRGQRAGRAGLATPEEMALLTAHITERSLARRTAGRATTPDPTAPPPLRRRSLDAELEEMAKRVAPGQTVQMGDPFDLAARALVAVTVSLAGLRGTSRGLDATQLLVSYAGAPDLDAATVEATARACSFFVLQPGAGQAAGQAVGLGRLRGGYDADRYTPRKLDANAMHKLDYSRPLVVVLLCERPEAQVKLRCRFRLLVQGSRG